MLNVHKLNKYYHIRGRKPLHVIDNTTLEIPEKGIIAVVGESGAGKTTLINTISGLDSFKNGKISFDDVSMTHYSNRIADKLRLKNYGFIFQNYYLLEKQTVYENVKISLDGFAISESEKKKRVNYVLNQLGIAKYTNKIVSNLSGGEQQRVSIARALVKSPRIIFADEPTGSLDEKTTFNVLNILKKVSQTCAVFIVTHEREIISYYADYIIELNNGVVVKEFTPVKPETKALAVDQNIYLSDLEHKDSHEQENVAIDIYTDGSSSPQSGVKIAIKNNRIYLEASENITVLTKESENHLIQDKQYEIKDYVDDNFDYSLEPIPYENNKIGFKEMLKKGYQNFKIKRPIKNVLKVVCVALTMLLLAITEGIGTIKNVDLSSDLSYSRGNLYLNIQPNAENMNSTKLGQAFKTIVEDVDNAPNDITAMFVSRDTLVFTYSGFYQIQQKQFALPNNDFRDIDYLDSKSLVFGQMPANGLEVVVDEYVLEHFLDKNTLKNIVTDYGYFVGKQLVSNYNQYTLTISGVCRTKNPTIYGHKSLNFFRMLHSVAVKVVDIDFAKQFYPSLAGVTIEKGHCLRSNFYGDVTFKDLIVDDYYSDDIPYDLIINPEDYLTMKYRPALNRHDIYLATNGSNAAIRECEKMVSSLEKKLAKQDMGVKITIENRYQDQYDEAISDYRDVLTSVEIVGLVLGGIALLLIILATYLSMLNQISDIAVFRSLGYSRFFLAMTYLIELFMLALIYCFIGGAIAFTTMFVLDVIPLVAFSIATPFVIFLGLTFLLAVAISLIGIFPIFMVFRLTPANIYNRYNRRITSE